MCVVKSNIVSVTRSIAILLNCERERKKEEDWHFYFNPTGIFTSTQLFVQNHESQCCRSKTLKLVFDRKNSKLKKKSKILTSKYFTKHMDFSNENLVLNLVLNSVQIPLEMICPDINKVQKNHKMRKQKFN